MALDVIKLGQDLIEYQMWCGGQPSRPVCRVLFPRVDNKKENLTGLISIKT